jgi:hypothetical protein
MLLSSQLTHVSIEVLISPREEQQTSAENDQQKKIDKDSSASTSNKKNKVPVC